MIDTVPNVLYHYTSLTAACSIAESQSVWVSDIRHLNDATEFEYGYQMALDIGRDLNLHVPQGPTWSMTDSFANISVFVFSLSTHGDLLSQWRAYCPDGGISIGFAPNNLGAIMAQYGFSLEKCEYDATKQREDLEEFLTLRQADASIPHEANSSVSPSSDRLERYQNFLKELIRILATYKHPDFSEESEYRFISKPVIMHKTPQKVRWRTARNLPVQFIPVKLMEPLNKDEIDLYTENQGGLILDYIADFGRGSPNPVFPPVREIIIGPHPHQALVETSMSNMFFKRFPYLVSGRSPKGNLRIKSSPTPYRSQ